MELLKRSMLRRSNSFDAFTIDCVSTIFSKNMKFRRFSSLESSTSIETEDVSENEELVPLEPPRKSFSCVTVPDPLVRAATKVLVDNDKANILLAAQEFCQVLYSRRLPIEKEEYSKRLENLMNKYIERACSRNQPICLTEEKIQKAEKAFHKGLLCELYRWKAIDYDQHISKVYMAARLAGNYASLSGIFKEIKTNLPSFQPRSFFDYGSGIGTGIWAAHEAWGNTISEYFCVDSSPHMNALAELLLKDIDKSSMLLKLISFRQFLPATCTISYDLVISAHSMIELPSMKARMQAIDILWKKTNDILVLVENGSNAGFTAVLDARDYILHVERKAKEKDPSRSVMAHVIAPCPHDMLCPKFSSTPGIPCNFEVPYNSIFRQSQRINKEMFSYVILQKRERPQNVEPWPRIISPNIKSSKRRQCTMCCYDGKIHSIVFTKKKHGCPLFQCVKKSRWGNLLPFPLSSLPKRDENSYAYDTTTGT